MCKIISFEDWVYSWSPEKKLLFSKKIKEHNLTEIDVIVFINAVQLGFTCKEVAKGLGISIHSVRHRLANVRKKFDILRIYNKNSPKPEPKIAKYDERIHGIVDKKFRRRNTEGRIDGRLFPQNDDEHIIRQF